MNLGIIYDKLTPEVQAKIIQDIIASKSVIDLYKKGCIICTPNPSELYNSYHSRISKDKTILGCPFSDKLNNTKICIVYKAKDGDVDYPSTCDYIVERDFRKMYKKSPLRLTPSANPPLKEDHRYSFSNTSRMYNYRSGFCPPDAAMIMMWGPVKA